MNRIDPGETADRGGSRTRKPTAEPDGGADAEAVVVPGMRDVRGTLDRAADPVDPAACVVAAPPHPEARGHRGDERLVAVSAALTARGVDCCRIDYGPWDEGRGEREDVRNAIRWAADRYDRVGVFGYSFGAGLSILAAATVDRPVGAVAALAPPARLGADLDVVDAVDALAAPLLVVAGERDDTVAWRPVAARAGALGHEVTRLPADHFFVDRADRIGALVADWAAGELTGQSAER